jgi:hypothetical protein
MSDATFTVDIIQFMLPYGNKQYVTTELSARVKDAYMDMLRHGYHFEAEKLSTGMVSITISSKSEDLDGRVVANDCQVQLGLEAMLDAKKWEHD